MRRRVPEPNNRSFTGRHALPDGQGQVRFESSLERDFLLLLRFRADVTSVVEQPATIPFTDGAGRRRHYTPDFLVTYLSGPQVLYEVKFREELRRNWERRYREAFRHARAWARERGMRFNVMTDLRIRKPRLLNARALSPFRQLSPDPSVAAEIRAALSRGPLSVRQLVSVVPLRAEAVYGALWSMAAAGSVRCDLDQPIGLDFMVG